MSTALMPQGTAQALAIRHELDVSEVIAQVKKIQLVMAEVMKEGEHYGVIPGTNKPTLLKPGAEKLLLTFRFDPQYDSAEVYEGKHLTVKSKCTLFHIPTGLRMGSGEGSCSTKESRYAYREQKRTCPRCGMEAILKSKFPPKSNPKAEPGWYCFAKRGGCGFEYAADDPAIADQKIGKVPNEDVADQYNTVLKMSNKRSLVAAVLNVTAASDIFTQDLEDRIPEPSAEAGRDITGESASQYRAGVSKPQDGAREAQTASAPRVRESDGAARPAGTSASAGAPSSDPEPHRGESEILFPTAEDDERNALVKRIQTAGAKLTKQARGKLKEVFLGDAEADITKADIAALSALAKHVEESAAK